MRLGLCCAPDKIEIAARLGFDYMEGNLSALAGMPEEDYQALLRKAPSFPIPFLKCNCFLPGDIHVTGPEAKPEEQRAYLERAFSRAHALGVETVVFGSGGARRVPEGFSHVTAWRQIADFLRLVGEYGEKYQISTAIEPLRRKECNIINLVSEGTLLSALVNHPRVGVLGDTFHMLCGSEPWASLEYAGEKLLHVHISHPLPDLSGRDFPAPGDGCDYAEIFQALKRMGYQGDVSLEAGYKDLEKDGAAAIACLRPLM